MDELSVRYINVANGPHGQLHDPAAVVNFVDQMQVVMERSSAPRKNFLLDTTTPHGDVIVTEASAMKPGNGWITLQVTEGIRRGVHEWCVKIEHQGETTDGSGMMLGIVPKSFAKYDSFISQGGGWCISRAGKFYGHWRRQDANASVVFGTGDRVILTLDYEASRMTVRVGDKSVVGEISNLPTEVYPAVSLHYRHQFVRFEYHKVHDRHAKKLNWIERFAFPEASVYLPLRPDQLDKVPLDSYVFSPLFIDKEGNGTRRKCLHTTSTTTTTTTTTATTTSTTTTTTTTAATSTSTSANVNNNTNTSIPATNTSAAGVPVSGTTVADLSSSQSEETGNFSEEYGAPRAANARLTVVLRAIQAVRRYCSDGSTPSEMFLDPGVTAETLRRDQHALLNSNVNSRGGTDAALNCGALVLIYMFSHASMTTSSPTMLPLVRNLQEYLRGITLFALAEACSPPQNLGTSLSPDVVRMALDNVVALIERVHRNGENDGSPRKGGNHNSNAGISGDCLEPALVELLVLMALQCGAVSEVLRAVRYLLRIPNYEVSQATKLWLQETESALKPKCYLPNINAAIDAAEEDIEQLTLFERDVGSTILSVGYDQGSIYIHTIHGLSKRNNVAGVYALVGITSEPKQCCTQCSRSSIAFGETGTLLLLTDNMVSAGIAVVIYNTALMIRSIVKLADAPQWPVNSRYMSIVSGPGDQIVLVYTTPHATSASPIEDASDDAAGSPRLEMHLFNARSFPEVQQCGFLQAVPLDRTLSSCLSLRKGCVVDFGSPEACLTTTGGHVTVEVWIKILEKDDTSVFYQHGDRASSGEVFLETTRVEGAWRIRGGYRHDSRGMCVVAAPVAPASENNFIHVVLVFDGNWRLYLNSEEVSRTKQGPQVSLENPRYRWTAGNDCVCRLAALRVWRGSRTFSEIVRDSRRILSGDEPGLLSQYLFNERNGNVAYNHVRSGPAFGRYAIIKGHFTRVGCFDHPLLSSLHNSISSGVASGRTPVVDITAGELPRLGNTQLFFNGTHLGLVEKKVDAISGFPVLKHVRQLIFFNIKTGKSENGSFVLRQRTKMGFIGCDRSGQYWEIFHTKPESNTPAEGSQQQVLAAGMLSGISAPLREKSTRTSWNYGIDPQSYCSSTNAHRNGGEEGTFHSCLNECKGDVQVVVDIQAPRLTFGSLAQWLLSILSSYAESTNGENEYQLFSPLLDDVGVRCVQEVQLLLREHCRVVKTINSRRSVNLKDNASASIITTTLRILIRLIRRVCEFKLHPDSIALSEIRRVDDIKGVVDVLNIIQRRRIVGWQENGRLMISNSTPMGTTIVVSPSSSSILPGVSAAIDTSTSVGSVMKRGSTNPSNNSFDGVSPLALQRGTSLLGLLADILNEAGFNIPAELAILASVIIREGVSLFFPSAAVRAKLLREILSCDQRSTPRSPAMNVLLDAIVKSFTDISSAAALVRTMDDTSNRKDNDKEDIDSPTQEKLLVIKTTLSTLLTESLRQMTFQIPNEPRQQQLSILSSISEAIGALQLLLIGQCSSVALSDFGESGMYRTLSSIFALPLSSSLNPILKSYYSELFDTAEMTFKKLHQQLSAPCEKSLKIGKVTSSDTEDMVVDILGCSFVSFPLHTAITALPLIITREESDWLLCKLNSLRVQYQSLLALLSEYLSQRRQRTDRWSLPILDTALTLASSWMASFMSLGQLTYGPPGTTPTSSNTMEHGSNNNNNNNNNNSNNNLNAILQEVCDNPLLSGGIHSSKDETTPHLSLINDMYRRHRKKWESIARKNDPLASKTPPDVGSLISLAAAAIVHLSSEQLNHLSEEDCCNLFASTSLLLKGMRNELLDRRSQNSGDFNRFICDAQDKCRLLLRMERAAETDHVRLSSLFLARSFADKVSLRKSCKSSRWKRALLIMRLEKVYHSALIHNWSALQIEAATSLVQRIILSLELTASKLRGTLEFREKMASQRLDGLRHMKRLFEGDPVSASKFVSLLFNGAVGSRLHFETGVSGCSSRTRLDLRHTMYEILRHLCLVTNLSATVVGDTRKKAGGGGAETATTNTTTTSSGGEGDVVDDGDGDGDGDDNNNDEGSLAGKTTDSDSFHPAILSEVLNRNWLPRDFCFLQQQYVVKVVFRSFCTIFMNDNSGVLCPQHATERSHRQESRGTRRQMPISKSSGTADDETNKLTIQLAPQESALMESLKVLKSLGLQCAVSLGDSGVALSERRGCALFLDSLFEELELELHSCLQYVMRPNSLGQDRVLEQMSLICTFASTIAQAFPDKFLCNQYVCPYMLLLVFRLCVLANFLAITRTISISVVKSVAVPNLVEMCIRTSVLLLHHCHPSAINPLFGAEETTMLTKEMIRTVCGRSLTLEFLFAFALRCVSNGFLSDTGMRCADALHTLVCRAPWGDEFCELQDAFLADLVCTAEGEEDARGKGACLLVWAYVIGGIPTSLLGPGSKVQISVDDSLTTMETAYIVDYQQKSNVVTVLPALSYNLFEEREVALENIINASQNEVILPHPNVLLVFLLPALEHLFSLPLKSSPAPFLWAVIASFLRITLGVLKTDPFTSQALLEQDIISRVNSFASRVIAKVPLPLCYLYEVVPIILQQLLQFPRQITFDAVVPSSLTSNIQNTLSTILYNQQSHNVQFHRFPPLAAPTPIQPVMSGGTDAAVNTSAESRLESDNYNTLPCISHFAQGHNTTCLIPSVLCFNGTKDSLTGTLTLRGYGKKSIIPQWKDGVTLEASVMLYDHPFLELGEAFVIPSSWQQPQTDFTLFALYEKTRTSTVPLLSVVLLDNSLQCLIEDTQGEVVVASTKLLREDWDRWIHIALVVESKGVTLYKDGIGTTTTIPKAFASRLEALLRDCGIGQVIMGNEIPGCQDKIVSPSGRTGTGVNLSMKRVNESKNGDGCEVIDSMMVCVDSVRFWGCARAPKAQRTIADTVAREQSLPIGGVTDAYHVFFRFLESSGSETFSENKDCIGILCGGVHWAPFPVFSGTVNLEKPPRSDMTSHAELPLFVPRHEFEMFFAGLDRTQLIQIGSEYLQSITAHLSRQCVLAAIRQAVSPAYHALRRNEERKEGGSNDKGTPSQALPNATIVNPGNIIGSADLVRPLINLLRYSDTGVIDEDMLLTVSEFIKLWFLSISSTQQLEYGFQEAARAISDALYDDTESFSIELAPLSHVTTDIQLIPIAILNGPGGTISFDAKSRGIEHLTLLRDRRQKVLLAKYPDVQGGWPELEIPNDILWFYLRPIVSSRSVASTLTVTARSVRPFVACNIFSVLRELLATHVRLHCGLPFFLNTPFVSLLTVHAGTTKSSALPARRLLTALLELWRTVPNFGQHDQTPLKILFAHLNAPLLSVVQRGQISSKGLSLPSPPVGFYNLTVQSSFELLVAAMRLEAGWKNVSHEYFTRKRWKRLYSLWEGSIGFGTPTLHTMKGIQEPSILERGYVQLVTLPSSSTPTQHRPKTTICQRGNGVWYAYCDRGLMSARSSIGFKRGRFYFEVRIPASGDAISVGVVTDRVQQQSVLTSQGLGHDCESWGFESSQMCRFNHGFRHEFAVRTKWKALDVIGILLDLEAGTLVCLHDDRQVSMFDNLKVNRANSSSTSYFPAVSFGVSGVDVNFGAAPFTCSLPIGFLPVDPLNYMTSPTSMLWTLLAAVDVSEVVVSSNVDNTTNSNHISSDKSNNQTGDNHTSERRGKPLPRFFEEANMIANAYQHGRSGPFSVSLLPCDNKMKMSVLHGNEIRAEDETCFLRGTVCVRMGCWYYEVVVRGDAQVSVGWVTSTAVAQWSRSKSLGDTRDSWVLEVGRATARHNKHRRSVGGQLWKHGDVIGCMVDCNAGTIAYRVNGIPVREVHDTKGNGVLFFNVKCTNGLMPVISVDPKNSALVCFRDDELSFQPCGYRAISTVLPLRVALEQYYTQDEDSKQIVMEGSNDNLAFSPLQAQLLLSSLSTLTELNFYNPMAYCPDEALRNSGHDFFYDQLGGREKAMNLFITLQNLTSLTEFLVPYAHWALLGECDMFLTGPICRSLRSCRQYTLPVVALRVLHKFSLQTNSPGEKVKLTLNRRKALSLVKDLSTPLSERMRGSLFGQVYQLLHEKDVSFFCTGKKLWSVNFLGEGADDIGGPYRESITQLCSELMSSALPLFIPSPNQANDIGVSREVFVVQPEIEPPVRLTMYQFLGRLIAGCLRSAEPLPLYLPSRFWKALVGTPAEDSDFELIDKSSYQSYLYIRERTCGGDGEAMATDEEIAELCPGGFSVVDDAGKEVELFPGGKQLRVCRSNVDIFLNMVMHFKLHTMGNAQIKALVDGFHQVIPIYAVSLFKWYELERVVCGLPDYDSDKLLDSARYEGIDPKDTLVQYLRQVLRQFSRQERALFMRFVSGRERLPTGIRMRVMLDFHSWRRREGSHTTGDAAVGAPEGGAGTGRNSGNNGVSAETYDDDRLPHSSTCFYWLFLPRYSSVHVMRNRLLFAIQQCLDIDADFRVRGDIDVQTNVEPTLTVNVENDDEFEDFSHLR